MKVILCTPPSKGTEACWPPIGLMYLASYLKSKSNHEIKIMDAFSCNIDENQFLNQVKKENPDVIGLSCTSYTFLYSMKLLEKIKKMLPDIIIVVGGIHATFFAENILKNYKFIDFVIKGEGEITFSELINNLHDIRKLKNIKGLAFRYKNKLINNKTELISKLDILPFPDRELVKNNDYAHYSNGIRITSGKFTTILSSRGCPHNCIFCCCSALFNRVWRTRSVESILNELDEIYSQGYETCIFVDDNFSLLPERVLKICRGIKKRKIKMDLHCEGRVDRASFDVLKEMKEAGFSTIYYGMESGVQKVLDYYKKGTTTEQIRNAVKNSKKIGLNTIGSFIIGSPVETREDILKTLRFASDLRIILQINSLDIVPGSILWSELNKDNKVGKDDWKRVYGASKYYNNFSREELSDLIEYGYKIQFRKWLSPTALSDVVNLFTSQNRKIISENSPILLIKRLAKGLRPFRE